MLRKVALILKVLWGLVKAYLYIFWCRITRKKTAAFQSGQIAKIGQIIKITNGSAAGQVGKIIAYDERKDTYTVAEFILKKEEDSV